jgi:hypothetical protein
MNYRHTRSNEQDMNFNSIPALALCIALLAVNSANAQKLTGNKHLWLSDSTQVIYVASGTCPNCYHYLPSNLRVAKNQAGEPEISLLKISETENDPVTGGIMHLLLVWGLDSKQEAETQQVIRAEFDSLAIMVGAVTVNNPSDIETLSIEGDDALARVLREGIRGRSAASSVPGGKMALSFRFDELQIRTLLEYIEKKKASDTHFKIYLNSIVPDSESPGSYPAPTYLVLNFIKLYPLFQ